MKREGSSASEIKKLKAALPKGWQPIETAPRERVEWDTPPHILIVVEGSVVIASWEPATRQWWGDCCGTWAEEDATHWMPLPAPPEGLDV